MERRSSIRMITRVALGARAHRREFTLQLFDLSPVGCRIACPTPAFARGDRILIRFNDETTVPGRIAWRKAGSAGVKFSGRLPEAIARHIHADAAQAVGSPPITDWFLR